MVATCNDTEPHALEAALRRELPGAGAGSGNIAAHRLDLAESASVAAFADWYRHRHDALHVLINNAGILLDVFSR